MVLHLEHIRVAQTIGEEGNGTAFLIQTPRNHPQNVIAMPLHSLDVAAYRKFQRNKTPPSITLQDPAGNEAHAHVCYLPPRTTHHRKATYQGHLCSPHGDIILAQIVEAEEDFHLSRFKLSPPPSETMRVGIAGYPNGFQACGWGRYLPQESNLHQFEGFRAICQCGVSGAPIIQPNGHAIGMAILRHYNKPRLDFLSATALQQHLRAAYARMERSPKGLAYRISHIPSTKPRTLKTYGILMREQPTRE